MAVQVCRDTCKLAAEQIKGLSTQVIKDVLFNNRQAPALLPHAPTCPALRIQTSGVHATPCLPAESRSAC